MNTNEIKDIAQRQDQADIERMQMQLFLEDWGWLLYPAKEGVCEVPYAVYDHGDSTSTVYGNDLYKLVGHLIEIKETLSINKERTNYN